MGADDEDEMEMDEEDESARRGQSSAILFMPFERYINQSFCPSKVHNKCNNNFILFSILND